MNYNIPIPRSRGTTTPQNYTSQSIPQIPSIKDIILHALIVRIAYTDNHNEEFYPKLNNNTIELDIPQERLDKLQEISQGPKLTEFITWLIDSAAQPIYNRLDNLENELANFISTITITNSTTLIPPSRITNILVDATEEHIILTLDEPSPDKIITIKRIDGSINNITINTTTGLIDGETSLLLNNRYSSIQLTSDGINYFITGQSLGTSQFSTSFDDPNNSMYIGAL